MKLSMKRNLLSISLLFVASATYASTNVPNSITGDTQWNADGNPYVIQGKAVVVKGATLRIGPNVKVVFQGASALEVNGTLDVTGSAAAPAVFDMTQGGLQSELFLNGAEADISSAKFMSGVFLVQDSNLHLQWFEITKGSGLYLRGTGTASVKNGKIYGNATGVVLDGKVNATFRFDTITQNTYGLYLKGYSDLQFKNNSVHDNDKDVINSTPALNLGGNYWGTTDEKTAAAKMQGNVSLGPMVSLKDLLRVYIQTQLPEITQEMSVAMAKKEKKEARELAQKQKAMNKATQTAQAPAASTTSPQVSETTAPPAPEIPPAPSTAENTTEAASQPAPEAAAAAPETPVAPAPVEETGVVKTVQVKSLPPAPHQLKPLDLPPDQGNVAEMPASVPPATALPAASAAAAPAAGNEAASPMPPASPDLTLPPTGTASETTPPIPPEVSGSADNNSNASATTPPPAPPVPPASDTIAPPDITTSTAPPSTTSASPSAPESVPMPPELNEQIPPTTSTSPAPSAASTAPPSAPEPAAQPVSTTAVAPPPAPPVAAPANTNPEQSLTPPPMDSPALQLNANPTENQQNAVNSLNGVSGDIDGMQPPPLDIDVPKSSSSTSATQTQNGAATQKSNDSGVVLPPIKDSDVAPPKDLDLPPTDDLGNINLDSKNK